MNTAGLIGAIAARYLQDQLEAIGEDSSGTARFIIDCLTAEQTASVATAILQDAQLAPQIEIKLPASFMAGQGLPDSVLTDHRATHFRNATCEKPVLLVANTGDDEEQSLKELVPIGASQLQDRPDLWVRVAAEGLLLTSDHRKWWERALAGLCELRISSLDRLAGYVLQTRVGIQEDGLPVIVALGAALSALRIPRDSAYFNSLNEKTRGYTSRWKKLFDTAQKKRACFLLKQTPSQVPLTEDDLQTTFERVKDSIPETVHDIVRAFISSPAGWHDQSVQLSMCEWEAVAPLFDGFKRVPFNLGQATIDFYDERQPELLNDAELDYLKRLIRRKTTASDDDEDRTFYEDHRNELKEERKLKLAWDRFIFGKAFETEDFLTGIMLCMERLFSQQTPATERHLRIRCDRGTKKELRELNVDAGIFFATRYRGLKALFGNKVQWEVGSLFEFPALVEDWRAARKLNHSTARAALQLKFIVELEIEVAPGHSEVNSAQMIWHFNPDAVIAGYARDWARLQEHPLVYCGAHRKPLSGKGQFQTVDLSNVFTFVPVFGKERGTFVGVYKKAIDIGIAWLQNLSQARQQNLITDEAADILEKLFLAFQTSYSAAISLFSEKGLVSHELPRQMESYASLLDGVCTHAKGDRNRELLLRPLLRIGVVAVQGGRPTAVVAPWHPLRLGATAIKAHLVSDLIKRLLVPKQVEFGDSRLFFRDMQECLSHPFYPELAIGWDENQPELLCATDTVSDYTLHESSVAADDGLDDTNENPAGGANCVVDLVKRYLALQPHEHANLSVVLYNCDSSRLPQAVVEKIAAMDEDEENEVRCQVILRHRDAKRLRGLYEKIIAASDGDPDAYSASEATRDFMARLRIGIMADQAPIPASDDSRPTDIVFSQDVIARHARVEWFEEDATPVDPFSLIPAHWSRRRPAASDDLKSVVYLCCPAQTVEGWSYLAAIGSFYKGNCDRNAQVRWLPARLLDFRDTSTARIFEETHNLATWVVNYDELLDRR
ncbi:MAG: hypothetical protein EPN47_17980 [Acidobacteria bacterium]|nr:MAG: hypothetical protein EPN47_17980 [Acidobacteriota bacterium]